MIANVGCEDSDGRLHVHSVDEWCDVCRPLRGLTYERQGNHIVVGEPRPLDPNANMDPAHLVQQLTDTQHLAAIDAAYGAIEARGRAAGCTPEQIDIAQVLFEDGFEAALGAIA